MENELGRLLDLIYVQISTFPILLDKSDAILGGKYWLHIPFSTLVKC